jgi:hypothetical protein
MGLGSRATSLRRDIDRRAHQECPLGLVPNRLELLGGDEEDLLDAVVDVVFAHPEVPKQSSDHSPMFVDQTTKSRVLGSTVEEAATFPQLRER